MLIGVVVVVLVAAGIVFGTRAISKARGQKSMASVESTSTVGCPSGTESLSAVTASTEEDKTPLIASCQKVVLRLPVRTEDLTEIGFHQASYPYALKIDTSLPDADISKADNNRGTGNPVKQPHGEDAVFKGSVLRLWRVGGQGDPDTSIDVGAAPGSTILSPVDGTVVLVKPYKLYDKWDDFEIHIQPPHRPDLDVVLIHVQKPDVKAGDDVCGGVTQIGEVRKLSDKEPMQLRHYTPAGDEGNHVHVQVNNTKDPLYISMKKLEGAITTK